MTKALSTSSKLTRRSVGENDCGNSSKQLCNPSGIYVHDNFDLYVADTGNHRIQVFRNLSLYGETYFPGYSDFKPRDIVMDIRGALWVAVEGKDEIHQCWPTWCSCKIGCGEKGDKLHQPTHLGFDQYGNLFVLDRGNHRIQKYKLERNTCCK